MGAESKLIRDMKTIARVGAERALEYPTTAKERLIRDLLNIQTLHNSSSYGLIGDERYHTGGGWSLRQAKEIQEEITAFVEKLLSEKMGDALIPGWEQDFANGFSDFFGDNLDTEAEEAIDD